jgi:hypothetical protein
MGALTYSVRLCATRNEWEGWEHPKGTSCGVLRSLERGGKPTLANLFAYKTLNTPRVLLSGRRDGGR